MATKAQQFQTEQRLARRTLQAKNAEGPGGGTTPVAEEHVVHNQARRAAKNSPYELEPASAGTRPSRKSTRRSPTHLKTDSALRLRTMAKNAAPTTRAVTR